MTFHVGFGRDSGKRPRWGRENLVRRGKKLPELAIRFNLPPN